MVISEHLARAASFETSAAKLDAIHDTELYVIFLMRAATARVNAALHALGVTDPVAAGARTGDLNHSYKPQLEGDLPPEVQPMFAALKYIEDLRPEYVRGPLLLTPERVAACRRAHDDIVTRTTAIIERRKEVA